MQEESELTGATFGRNRRQLIRIRGSNEQEKKRESLATPSREEHTASRNMNSRRAASRNSRQAMKPTVNWVRGKTITGSLQEMFEGDFQPVNLRELGIFDGAYADEKEKVQHEWPNPDHFR
jgi:hypothetical protein